MNNLEIAFAVVEHKHVEFMGCSLNPELVFWSSGWKEYTLGGLSWSHILACSAPALPLRMQDCHLQVKRNRHLPHSQTIDPTPLRTPASWSIDPVVPTASAYPERKMVLPNGAEINLPAPTISDLRRETIEVIEEVGPSMLIDNMVLVSGEVARTTEFEKGFRSITLNAATSGNPTRSLWMTNAPSSMFVAKG